MRRNWAGNVHFEPAEVASPRRTDEVAEVVTAAIRQGRHVGAVGTAHSFSAVAATDGVLVATDRLRGIGPLDEAARTVTIEAGVRFAELGPWLDEQGWALANLPSLPHITVAGAAATGTHGSGVANPSISSAVVGLELVAGDGGVRRYAAGDAELAGAVVALGALGIVTRLDVAVVPSFDVAQRVWLGARFAAVLEHLGELLAAAYSVSLFTRWRSDVVDQIWVKSRAGDADRFDVARLGAVEATSPVHPVPGGDAAACTEQLGRPGPAHDRLAHFRAGFVPSAGAELQSEYFVAAPDAAAALEAVASIADLVAPVLHVSEIRAVAADDRWLSMASGRDSVALHFTWHDDVSAVQAVLPTVEAVLAPFGPRPHWGKLTALDTGTIRRAYPRIDDFDRLRVELDPVGVFAHESRDRLLARP